VNLINILQDAGGNEYVLNNEKGANKFKLGKTDDGEDTLLLRVIIDKRRGEIYQTMVPKHLVKKVLKLHHEGYSHLGINRMVETIKLRYFWKGLDNDVKEHVDKCINCKLRKTYQRRPKVPIMKYNAVSKPLDRVHIDLTGPLPPTQNGNRYILVIKDYLTKYVWLIPLASKTAMEVAESFVTRFVCQAGIPDMVVSDRGTEFTNSLLKNISSILGINRISTTPFNPRSDGFVENHNKTLKDQLFNYIDTLKQNDWDIYLPTVQLLYNTTVSLSTGYTPMMLMTGREGKMPSMNHMEKIENTLQPEMLNNEYVRKLVESIRNYHEEAIGYTEKNKLKFNVRVRNPLEFVEYEIGQRFMLVKRPVSEFKSSDEEQAYKITMKLVERYEGPYVIVKKINPILYDANIEGNIKRVHAIHMKPY
jgi:transposase InsO family protein